MPQGRGKCGHQRALWDDHDACMSCCGCSLLNPCGVSSKWADETWQSAAARRTHKSRQSRSRSGSRPAGSSPLSRAGSLSRNPTPRTGAGALELGNSRFGQTSPVKDHLAPAAVIGCSGYPPQRVGTGHQPPATGHARSGHSPGTGHRASPVTGSTRSGHSPGTGHRVSPATGRHRAPGKTGHRVSPATGRHRSPGNTGHRVSPGNTGHRVTPGNTGHRP